MVTPEQILIFAEALMGTAKPNELGARQATARAYYSVMLLVRKALFPPEKTPKKDTHKAVRDALTEHISKGSADGYLIEASDVWLSLIDARVAADYEIDDSFDIKRGHVAVARARKVFSLYKAP
jgi:hypothetical protein